MARCKVDMWGHPLMTVSFRTEPWTISYCTINDALKLAQTYSYFCCLYWPILAKCLQISVPILMLPSLHTAWWCLGGELWNHDHSCPYPSITMDTSIHQQNRASHFRTPCVVDTQYTGFYHSAHKLYSYYSIQYFVGLWISSTNFSLQLSGGKSSI